MNFVTSGLMLSIAQRYRWAFTADTRKITSLFEREFHLKRRVTRLSFRHLGHLWRQVGFAQAHMSMGGSVTFRPKEEIAQLSINFTCALIHFGHGGFGIRPPFLPHNMVDVAVFD
jgi:hypothetical protein